MQVYLEWQTPKNACHSILDTYYAAGCRITELTGTPKKKKKNGQIVPEASPFPRLSARPISAEWHVRGRLHITLGRVCRGGKSFLPLVLTGLNRLPETPSGKNSNEQNCWFSG